MSSKYVLLVFVFVSEITLGFSQKRLKCYDCEVDNTVPGIECRDSPQEYVLRDCLLQCLTVYENDNVILRTCGNDTPDECVEHDGKRYCSCGTDACNVASMLTGSLTTIITIVLTLVLFDGALKLLL